MAFEVNGYSLEKMTKVRICLKCGQKMEKHPGSLDGTCYGWYWKCPKCGQEESN